MITREKIQEIQKRSEDAQSDFKNRCFMVLEALVSGDIVCNDLEKLKGDVYKICHVGIGDCNNPHEDWVKEVEDLFTSFKKVGLI